MLKKTAAWICLACLALLPGCAPQTSIPVSATATTITIAVTPALRNWQNRLRNCALATTHTTLQIFEKPYSDQNLESVDLVLRLGAAENPAYFASLLGHDRVVVIINQTNPVQSLSQNDLIDLYRGQTLDWQTISEFQHPVQAWLYPEGDEIRSIFDTLVFGNSISIQGYLAPDPQAMLEAVAKEPGAIGYLPLSWLNETPAALHSELKAITLLDANLTLSLSQPILAISTAVPQGAVQDLLRCSQLQP